MNQLQIKMAKLRLRDIEKELARVNEFPCAGRAYLTRRIARLVNRRDVLKSQIDEAQTKAGTA